MDLRTAGDSESRFSDYVEGLVSVIGHADRAGPLHDYCVGLMMPSERKSVEPMAAMTAPGRTAAQHQSLLHFVGNATWSDERVLAKVREMVLPAIERHGPIEAWIIDDTGFPKKGEHSVGVARQYCGQLGKQDNCQVAVSLSIANRHASLPVAYRLYLPEDWAEDSKRRCKTGVPENIRFKTKPELALEQIDAACKAGLPRGVVLMDAGYGRNTDLRASVSALALFYVAGIMPHTSVWISGTGPLPPKSGRARGGHRSSSAGTASINRSRSRNSLSVCQSTLGARSSGEKARPSSCPRVLRAYAFVLRIVITISPSAPAALLNPSGTRGKAVHDAVRLEKFLVWAAAFSNVRLQTDRCGPRGKGGRTTLRPGSLCVGQLSTPPWRDQKDRGRGDSYRQ